MDKAEFLEKAIACIEQWKNGQIEKPEFCLIRESAKTIEDIEASHPLIVGEFVGITEKGFHVYRFNALAIKEILYNNSAPDFPPATPKHLRTR